MGACSSCCGDRSTTVQGGDDAYTRMRPSGPPSAEDLEARQRAADAAAARQQKFDTSAVGKAARKAVDDVKQERAAPRQGADRSQDWLS